MSTTQSSATKTSNSASRIAKPKSTNLNRSAASSTSSLASVSSKAESEARSGSTSSTVITGGSRNLRRSPSSNEILTADWENFKLGDRIFVNGSRPGTIRFIGETQFAPGKWSGIELDSEDGKNDGSVGGVKYFTCEAKKGIFVRPTRLTREQINDPGRSGSSTPTSHRSFSGANGHDQNSSQLKLSSQQKNDVPSLQSSIAGDLKVNDRVVVYATSGTKLGTLRFLGATDFAPGLWAGIELDDPTGKNDGSVGGKRYFTCSDKHGLFAPVHKVSRVPEIGQETGSTPFRVPHTPTSRQCLSKDKNQFGSQESVSSICSSSSAMGTRRTGLKPPSRQAIHVTSKTNGSGSATMIAAGGKQTPSSLKSSSSSIAPAVSATTQALHETLREKEEHIEQLLKEMNLERGEVARAASRVEELEEKIIQLEIEHSKFANEAEDEINELRRLASEYEVVNRQLQSQIEELTQKQKEAEEQMKVREEADDVAFQLEELQIVKTDLEAQKADLEAHLKAEKEKVKKMEHRLDEIMLEQKRQEEMRQAQLKTVQGQVDETQSILTEESTKLRKQLQEIEAKKEAEIFALQEDMVRKDDTIFQLQTSLEKRATECANLTKRLTDLDREIDSARSRHNKLLETIDDLNLKIRKLEAHNEQLEERKQEHETMITDLKSKVHSYEVKVDQVSFGKNKEMNELQDRIEELKKELASKKEEESNYKSVVKEKDAHIEKLMGEIKSLEEQIGSMKKKLEDETKSRLQAEDKQNDLLDRNRKLEEKIKELMKTSGSNSDQMMKLNEELNMKQRLIDSQADELRSIRDQIEELKRMHDRLEEEEHEMQTQLAHRIQDIQERDREIADLRGQLSDLRSGLDTTERDSRVQMEELEFKLIQTTKEKEHLEEELNEEIAKKNKALAERDQQLSRLKEEQRNMESRLSELEREMQTKITSLELEVKQRERQLNNLEEDLNAAQLECRSLKQLNSDLLEQRDHISKDDEIKNKYIEDRNKVIESLREELDNLQNQFHNLQSQLEERKRLAQADADEMLDLRDQIQEMRRQLEELSRDNTRLRQENVHLELKLNEIESDMGTSSSRHAEILNEFESECDRLQAKITTAEQRASAAEQRARQKEEQVKLLESRITERDSSLEMIRSRAETEKQSMTSQIKALESQIKELRDSMKNGNHVTRVMKTSTDITSNVSISPGGKSVSINHNHNHQNGSMNGTSSVGTAGRPHRSARDDLEDDERQQYDQQIEFLNSVIVDMQKKNDQLKSRIDILEQIGVTEFETREEVEAYKGNPAIRPPRLFCDICDMFDIHDTEDCPQQSSSLIMQERVERQSHSSYNYPRNTHRPYCANCEMFGHDTATCDEAQTF